MPSNAKKDAYWEWKREGKPKTLDSASFQTMKQTTRKLRSVQRTVYKEEDTRELNKISDAHTSKNHVFHLLVKRRSQSVKSRELEYLIVDDVKYETKEDICQAWAKHFRNLATPELSQDGSRYKQDVDNIAITCNRQKTPLEELSLADVQSLLKGLNRNKAADVHGLTVEHFLHAGPHTLQLLQKIINFIIKESKLPTGQKTGVLTPVYKKAEKYNPFNHRGITVTPVIEKITELYDLRQSAPVLTPTQHYLQRGFSKDTPPLLAGLLLQEVIQNTVDPVYLCMLDVKTAFDTVWHEALLRQLFLDGIEGTLWRSYENLYQDATSKVRWADCMSEPFPILQGVRQGAVCSAELYKRFNNPLLDRLTRSGAGATLGNHQVPAPTCADDVALVAFNPTDLQTMINIVQDFSTEMKYELQPRKTNILVVRPDETCSECFEA